MALTAGYKHGHTGYVEVGGYRLPVRSFNLKEEVELVDVTNAKSGGYMENVAGPKKMTGSLECIFDADQYPNDAPVAIEANANITVRNVLFEGSRQYDVDVIVQDVDIQSGQGSEVKYTVNWTSQGPYTLPTS